MLKKIIPVIETDYKILTTAEDQKQSFRAHVVKGIMNAPTMAGKAYAATRPFSTGVSKIGAGASKVKNMFAGPPPSNKMNQGIGALDFKDFTAGLQ